MQRIKVLVVDNSAVFRQAMAAILSANPGLEVLGVAADPLLAMRRMKSNWPDVIITDIEMPRMDGIAFVRKIMSERPTPVIICSRLTEKGARTTMDALAAGAVAIIAKPKLGVIELLDEFSVELVQAIKEAAQANIRRLAVLAPLLVVPKKHTADAILGPPEPHARVQATESVVAIGTSTGGTHALEEVLIALPRVSPGIVIVQHMPEGFTAAFAQRLNGLCEIEVKEAESNDRVVPGCALIAPGDHHLLLKRIGAQYFVDVVGGPRVNRHRPSVDVLFRSVAKSAGSNALGIIMTGMGDDGAAGLLEMHQAGSRTLAQDEDSCIVFGMPMEAIKRGGVSKVVPLNAIADEIMAQPTHSR